MHNLHSNYVVFLELCKSLLLEYLDTDGNVGFYPNRPQMADIEVIALAIVAEFMSIPSENWLFAKLKSDYKQQFPNLISRPRFNIRRRRLVSFVNQVCLAIATKTRTTDSALIIDSIPVPVCANPRISRSKACRDDAQVQPARGYHASHKQYYYGFKLQLIITQQGVPMAGSLYPANIHDVHALHEITQLQLADCELIADKGYLSSSYQLSLFEQMKIRLITPLRSNMKQAATSWNSGFRYKRKRIETLFSQLVDQFNLRSNYAKSLDGLLARIVTKLAGVALAQLINFQKNRPLNHLKYALVN
jgi:hypothetical protein